MPNLDRQDYVILNSVANVSKAIDVLHGYERIHCLLDNDEAGRNAYLDLARGVSGRIRDFSDNYRGHKDLNDYLCGKQQNITVNPPTNHRKTQEERAGIMTFRTRKTGDAQNSFFKDWEVASLCFGCTETACYPLPKF